MTWFELPSGISENSAKNYINLILTFCNATQKWDVTKGKGMGIQGLCFPMVTWPDDKNMIWFKKDPKWANSTHEVKRNILGQWICDHFLRPCENNNIAGGILLYTNFKDGPWNKFYPATKSPIPKNPLTGNPFTPQTSTTPQNEKFVWGAVIHFINNYIIPNYGGTRKFLSDHLWFHLDKEGCSCGNPSDYIKWMEQYIKLEEPKHGTRMLLATGIGTPGEAVQSENPDRPWKSISVPENYWSAGNQLPCGGDPGAYNHAMSACTNLNTHRRLANYPNAFQNLITGDQGSDNAAGWLGSGKWAAEIKTLKSKPPSTYKKEIDIYGPKWVWPSFSIENLSLCDTNDPNCYSRYMKEYKILKSQGKNPDPSNTGLKYSKKLDGQTTLCLNMLFGGSSNFQPSQGTRVCGVFDGFSFWSWEKMNDYLNLFCNESGAQNVIIYEASFIPYHWLEELQIFSNPKIKLSPLPPPQKLPVPVVTQYCSKDEDCKISNYDGGLNNNMKCLGPDWHPVDNSGKQGICSNICVNQPAGYKSPTEQTIWVGRTTQEKADERCTTYYKSPGATLKGMLSPDNSPRSYTNQFKSPCIGKSWPLGVVSAKATSGKSPYYSCHYNQIKASAADSCHGRKSPDPDCKKKQYYLGTYQGQFGGYACPGKKCTQCKESGVVPVYSTPINDPKSDPVACCFPQAAGKCKSPP